jgi:MGT family glycosyltransferase
MSSVCFVSWWGGGNMTPVLALGARMRERGHDVSVLGPARFGERLALDDVRHIASASWSPTADEVRAAIDGARPDLLVVDFMMADVLAALPSFGLPRTAALVHTLWQPVADRVWDSVGAFTSLENINAIRATHARAAVEHSVELLRDVDHIVIAEPEPIDRTVESDWPTARYLGPLMEPAGFDGGWTPPFDADDDRPLVVVSLGTTPMNEQPVLERVALALAGVEARVFVTVGDHLDPGVVEPSPNTVVGRYTRHAAVMPHASLVVTHAGLGTVIAAAAHGVPVVASPLGRDQPGNAARIVELGIGASLDASAGVDEIRAVVDRLLIAGGERAAAQALRDEIARRHPSPYDEFDRLL